ncbi:MAG: hypothetical protein HY717_23780 [Planctomycetes bacterium]|nr:hypothetical protein [Planctomycetota bacterium]
MIHCTIGWIQPLFFPSCAGLGGAPAAGPVAEGAGAPGLTGCVLSLSGVEDGFALAGVVALAVEPAAGWPAVVEERRTPGREGWVGCGDGA